MPDRKAEPWESGAAGAFPRIEKPHGVVQVWALGSERFSVRAPDHEEVVVGFEEVRQTAHAVAERLG